jgi:3-isopropylmalate dehydrogenase
MHVEAHADCIADPAGVLYSFALLLRYSLDLPGPADRLNRAVTAVIKDGLCTAGMIAGNPRRVLPDVEFCSGVLSRLKSDVDAVTAGRVDHA